MAKVKKSGLGRDFNSLFEDNFIDTKKTPAQMIRISDIEPNPDQPRKTFDEAELSLMIYDKLIETNPEFLKAYYNKAAMLMGMGNFKEASKTFFKSSRV